MMHVLRVLAINLLLSALVIAAAALVYRADRLLPFALPEQLQFLELPCLIVGTLLILAAEYSFIKEGRATGAPGNPPVHLVTTGVYRWVRNPIYLGVVLLLFGIAFFHGSPGMLVVALLFLPVIHMVVVRVEEPRTERRFGAAYTRYKQNVPRWLPRSPKRDNNGDA
jgi:protein-S-isoprenylcysteine O-methyltransferase Ste14